MSDNTRVGILSLLTGWLVLVGYLAFANTKYLNIFIPNIVTLLALAFGLYAILIKRETFIKGFVGFLILQLFLYGGLVLDFVFGPSFRVYLQDQISSFDFANESSKINWQRVVWFGRTTFETVLALQFILIIYVVVFVNSYARKLMSSVELALIAMVPLVATIYGVAIVTFVSSDAFGEYVKSYIIGQGGTGQSLNLDFITLLGQIVWASIFGTQVLVAIFVTYYLKGTFKLATKLKEKEEIVNGEQREPKKAWDIKKRFERLRKMKLGK